MIGPAIRAGLCGPDIDAVLHPAALPGAAAERDPAASRTFNFDVPVSLVEPMQGRRLITDPGCAGCDELAPVRTGLCRQPHDCRAGCREVPDAAKLPAMNVAMGDLVEPLGHRGEVGGLIYNGIRRPA